MRIHLQRAIKMRSLLYWTFPIILDHTTPESGLVFILSALQFEPGVVSIDSPAGKEVPDLLRANHDIHAHCVATPNHRLHTVQGRGHGRHLALSFGAYFRFCFFAEDRKSTRLNSSHQIISYAVFCLKKKNGYSDLLQLSYLV